jgi:hypothetical protein
MLDESTIIPQCVDIPNMKHLYRFATLTATGEVVRLDYYSSLTDSYSIIIPGNSYPTSEIPASQLSNFYR